jgi:phosphatidyl-myo-inositol dimannoside synthase
MPGFIPEEELATHFSLADIYVMPSMKEGFGIVFVEAMYYGVPVIAGNVDGSTDALLQGKLGLLIEPDNPAEITEALEKMIKKRETYVPDYALLMDNFGYENYKRKLEEVLKAS